MEMETTGVETETIDPEPAPIDLRRVRSQLKQVINQIDVMLRRDPEPLDPESFEGMKAAVAAEHAKLTADRADFGSRLRAARLSKGIRSASAAAGIVGIDPQVMRDYENGKHAPSPRRLVEIVTHLGIDWRDLR